MHLPDQDPIDSKLIAQFAGVANGVHGCFCISWCKVEQKDLVIIHMRFIEVLTTCVLFRTPCTPDSLYDRPPPYLVVKFTLRKKVNQKFRKNRQCRKLIRAAAAAAAAAAFGVPSDEDEDAIGEDLFVLAFGQNAFAFFDDAVEEEAGVGAEEVADLFQDLLEEKTYSEAEDGKSDK